MVNHYESLCEAEKEYWQKLLTLFQLVNPKYPEKGAQSLILRARKAAQDNGTELTVELETMFQAATERTLRRVELLNRCRL